MEKSDSLSRLTKLGILEEPKVIDVSVRHQDKVEFDLFKEYETTSQLVVYSAEALSSPIVGELSAGSCVTVLSIGSGGRLKVTNPLGTVQGWVCSVSLGKSQLRKLDKSKDKPTLNSGLRSNSLSSLLSDSSLASRASRASRTVSSSLAKLRAKKDDFKDLGLEPTRNPQIGDMLEAAGKTIVRSDESVASLKILKLKAGAQLRILDYGKTDPNRVKVSILDGSGMTGWVSVLEKNLHEPLFGKRPNPY